MAASDQLPEVEKLYLTYYGRGADSAGLAYWAVRLDSVGGLRAGAVIYPKGKTWRLEGTTENLLVYGGEFDVKIPLIIDHDASPGDRVVKGSVDFQACDNHVCFLPESAPISVTVKIQPRGK